MAIPIKEEKPKIKKAQSTAIRSGDDEYGVISRSICDLYIASNNMATAYDLFRRATLGSEYLPIESNTSNASIWFKKIENINYIARRKAEIYKLGFDEYCKMKGIEHADFKDVEDKYAERNVNKSPAEIREETLIDLQKVIDNPTDDQTLLAAIKQRTEITDAKYKDKGTELSETEKLIHFYLPASICDKCPNRTEIENQFKDLPEIELNLDEDDQA